MRIVVVGTSGAGKTTLARRIAAQLQLPHIELDAINWQSEWRDLTRHDPEEFVRRVTGGEGKAVEHSAKAEYSALPQITNGEAITSTNGTIIGSPASAFAPDNRHPISGPCTLKWTDDETAALIQELHVLDDIDRYPFSPRIRTLRAGPRQAQAGAAIEPHRTLKDPP